MLSPLQIARTLNIDAILDLVEAAERRVRDRLAADTHDFKIIGEGMAILDRAMSIRKTIAQIHVTFENPDITPPDPAPDSPPSPAPPSAPAADPADDTVTDLPAGNDASDGFNPDTLLHLKKLMDYAGGPGTFDKQFAAIQAGVDRELADLDADPFDADFMKDFFPTSLPPQSTPSNPTDPLGPLGPLRPLGPLAPLAPLAPLPPLDRLGPASSLSPFSAKPIPPLREKSMPAMGSFNFAPASPASPGVPNNFASPRACALIPWQRLPRYTEITDQRSKKFANNSTPQPQTPQPQALASDSTSTPIPSAQTTPAPHSAFGISNGMPVICRSSLHSALDSPTPPDTS